MISRVVNFTSPYRDKEVEKFIHDHVDSFIKWDLIVFFYRNQGIVETFSGIAKNLGRKEEEVKQALDKLIKKKIVIAEDYDEGRFKYSISEECLDVVKRFVDLLKVRENRLALLTQVLRRGKV